MRLGDMLVPALRLLPPEAAHRLTIQLLRLSDALPGQERPPKALATTAFGKQFPSPVGLAAGFDKDAEAVRGAFKLGLGFMEVGTITPRPQDGNAKPRLFRLVEDFAVVNRMGFNNRGMVSATKTLNAVRNGKPLCGILGINIGKNKTSEDAAADYAACARSLAAFADYLTINVSSPNTPGLRALQSAESLRTLVSAVRDNATEAGAAGVPILIKIAPDLEENDLAEVLEVAQDPDVAGLIVSNTTITRPDSLRSEHKNQTGGLSGAPLRDKAKDMLHQCYAKTQGQVLLVGVGGIATPQDAYDRIRAGASLVQLYTALVYEGPGLIRKINQGLVDCLRQDGFRTISEAIGADHR